MSYQEDRFLEIASAIRAKDGTTAPIKATDFAGRIEAIPSGGGGEDWYKDKVKYVLNSAKRGDNFVTAWASQNQITVDGSGAVTGKSGTAKADIVIPETAKTMPNVSLSAGVFYSWRDTVKSISLPATLTSIGNYAFYELNEVDGILMLPDGVTTLGRGTFGNWRKNNRQLIIPQSLTTIARDAFQFWQANEQQLVLHDGITTIESGAFRNWESNNQPLVLPQNISSIVDTAFASWGANTHPVVFPASITSVAANAFAGWTSVPYFKMERTVPFTIGSAAFGLTSLTFPIYVPDESVDDYKTATNWTAYATRIKPVSELEV